MGKQQMHDLPYVRTAVYQWLWMHWISYDAAPNPKDLAAECGLRPWELKYVLDDLRRQGRIEYGKALMPVAYRAWRANNPRCSTPTRGG